jgi:hypothetical protein
MAGCFNMFKQVVVKDIISSLIRMANTQLQEEAVDLLQVYGPASSFHQALLF